MRPWTTFSVCVCVGSLHTGVLWIVVLTQRRAGPSVRFVVFDDSTGAEIKPGNASRRSLITPNLLDLEEHGVTQPIRRDNLPPP